MEHSIIAEGCRRDNTSHPALHWLIIIYSPGYTSKLIGIGIWIITNLEVGSAWFETELANAAASAMAVIWFAAVKWHL